MNFRKLVVAGVATACMFIVCRVDAQTKKKPVPSAAKKPAKQIKLVKEPVASQNQTPVGNPIIYQYVSQMPEFSGDVYNWLSTEVRYPDSARIHNIEGRVGVSFIINTEGDVKEVKVARTSGNDYLDAEAIRAVSTMPKWKPGKNNGEAVNVSFSLPITFKLD